MTNYHDFNNKVDISKLANSLGLQGCNIQKIFPFGEFAFNSDKTQAWNVYSLGKGSLSSGEVYRKITQEMPDFLKQYEVYSEYREKKINQETKEHDTWIKILNDSRIALHKQKYALLPEGSKISLADYYKQNGLVGIFDNQIGHLSIDVKNNYNFIDWSAINNYKKPLLIPYFHTPFHLSYIEIIEAIHHTNRKIIYANSRIGWAGSLNKVLFNFDALFLNPGFIWNYTADFWTFKPVDIDFNCNVDLLIKIFNESKYTQFTTDPLDLIIEKKLEDKVQYCLRGLAKEKILYLEERLKTNLIKEWQKIQETEFSIGDKIFYKRPDGYYSLYKGISTKLTNFTLTFKERIKNSDNTFYLIEANMDDKNTIVSIPYEVLGSINKIKVYLREALQDANLGLPQYKHPDAESHLLNFIFDYFNN